MMPILGSHQFPCHCLHPVIPEVRAGDRTGQEPRSPAQSPDTPRHPSWPGRSLSKDPGTEPSGLPESILELSLLLTSPCSNAVGWVGRPLREKGSSGDRPTWTPRKPDHSTNSSPPRRQAGSCPLFPDSPHVWQLPAPARAASSQPKGSGSRGCFPQTFQHHVGSSERWGSPGLGTGEGSWGFTPLHLIQLLFQGEDTRCPMGS